MYVNILIVTLLASYFPRLGTMWRRPDVCWFVLCDKSWSVWYYCCFRPDDLKCARLLKGIKPEALMVTAPYHCVFTVYMQFGTFIKFSVEVLTELATPVASSSSTSQPQNASPSPGKRSYVQWYTSPHKKNGFSLDWPIGAWCAIVEMHCGA